MIILGLRDRALIALVVAELVCAGVFALGVYHAFVDPSGGVLAGAIALALFFLVFGGVTVGLISVLGEGDQHA